MPVIESLTLRVNGRIYEKVQGRFAIEGGYPGGPLELVIHDPDLGDVVLSDACLIELSENGGPFLPIKTHALTTKLRILTEGL